MAESARILVFAVTLLSLAGCSDDAGVTQRQSMQVEPPVCTARCRHYASRPTQELFDWPTVPDLRLSLPPERWSHLLKHAEEEEYEPATISFEGEPIGKVAVRFKGATGTLRSCINDDNELVCEKLSLRVKLSAYDSTLRFFGVERVNLHSMVRDPTKIRERLGYDLYRSMGVIAPRSTWATLVVNEEPLGLFSLVEVIDGRFTEDRWAPHGDGNLYKNAWPASEEPSYYAARLETGESDPAHKAFTQFATALDTAAVGERGSVLTQYMDRDYLNRYLAVDDAIHNWDGITNFSCGEQQCANKNYFVYQDVTRPFFWLIPWDLDNTFMLRTPMVQVPHWQHPMPDCSVRWSVSTIAKAAPACDTTFAALAEDLSGYRAAIDELVARDFSVEVLDGAIQRHTAFIDESVRNDPRGSGEQAWRIAVERLHADTRVLRERLIRLRDRVPVYPLVLDVTHPNDFEQEDHLSLALGEWSVTNPGSSIAATVTSDASLAGQRSVSIEFVYRNAPTGDPAWSQWATTELSLRGGPQDLRQGTGIRMRMRADRLRVVSIALGSPQYKEFKYFGWQVPVGTATTQVDVLLADASIPSWAGSTEDDLQTILSAVETLRFGARCEGRNSAGVLPDGMVDAGKLEIDDIELYVD